MDENAEQPGRSLEDRLDALESRQQITEVLYRYCRGWDRRDMDIVMSCFWPGSTHQHASYKGSSADFIPFGLERTATIKGARHAVTNVMIELDGDRALSECYWAAYHRRPTADGTDEEDYFVGGRFVDRFQRRDGEWRIVHRRGLNEYERVEARADVNHAKLGSDAVSQRGRHDPLYAMLAEFKAGL